jgi:hypothetical protein
MRWSVCWASLVSRGAVEGGLIWLSHTRAIRPGFSTAQYIYSAGACGACSAATSLCARTIERTRLEHGRSLAATMLHSRPNAPAKLRANQQERARSTRNPQLARQLQRSLASSEETPDYRQIGRSCGPCRRRVRPMATVSAHTASPPPPSRTPAGSRASSRHASIAPRTTSAHGPLAWGAPRTRTHRSIPAPPTPAGA